MAARCGDLGGFMFSLVADWVLSLVAEMPSRIFLVFLAVEMLGGLWALAVLAREKRKAEVRR
jgi:nitrate/nitrite transporter NarK